MTDSIDKRINWFAEWIESIMEAIKNGEPNEKIKEDVRSLKEHLKRFKDRHHRLGDAYIHCPKLNTHPIKSDWYSKLYDMRIDLRL
jgi:hypothetical protein